MTQDQIKEVLRLHGMWWRGEDGGVKANLSGADLRGANLIGADLRDADLRGASLSGADLSGASLRGADLRDASLIGASLSGADLRGASLIGASLSGASLRDADLSGASLIGASLSGADIRGASLIGAKGVSPLTAARLSITPDGDLIGWKKCKSNVLVRLSIPADAKRSNATGRKCRAEFVDVLEVIGAEVGISQHDGVTQYRAGQRVTCDAWCEDRWRECAGGIHFFLTREEAEGY